MNKSQKIYFISGNTNDMHIKVHLEQEIDTIELLSMNITTEEAYQNFNADYGVLVGRVVANGGVGIPNAKISIFIPLTDADAENGEMSNLYPYKTPRDKNIEGKRYNLLPRVSKINPATGVASPKQPFGSFPIKEEIVTNTSLMNMYKKYYKYTALTNESGDYMIFGVPIGVQTVHMSVDITDIGQYSMTPVAMITNLGYSPNLFSQDGSLIKPSNDLDDLPNIETQEIDVNIIPFWGDSKNLEIGITRQDFRIRSAIKTTFVLFGSVFTDNADAMWGSDFYENRPAKIAELYRASDPGEDSYDIANKRASNVIEKIYYYPNYVSDDEIDAGLIDTDSQILQLDSSEYTIYKSNGDFVFIIPCKRRKIITNDAGNETVVSDDSPNGIYTEFRGFVTLEMNDEMNRTDDLGENVSIEVMRVKYKFPQHAGVSGTFQPDGYGNNEKTARWRMQSFKFESGKFYTISKYHPVAGNNGGDSNHDNSDQFPVTSRGYFARTCLNSSYNIGCDPNWDVGVIRTNTVNPEYPNTMYEFPSNFKFNDGNNGFGVNWLNMAVYFPQIARVKKSSSSYAICYVDTVDWFAVPKQGDDYYSGFFAYDNAQKFVAGQINTKWYPRSDLNWTDIVEVPAQDILTMSEISTKGFCRNSNINNNLIGCYRNGEYIPSISTTDVVNAWENHSPYGCSMHNCSNSNISLPANTTYFYKGYGESNVINYLLSLNLV